MARSWPEWPGWISGLRCPTRCPPWPRQDQETQDQESSVQGCLLQILPRGKGPLSHQGPALAGAIPGLAVPKDPAPVLPVRLAGDAMMTPAQNMGKERRKTCAGCIFQTAGPRKCSNQKPKAGAPGARMAAGTPGVAGITGEAEAVATRIPDRKPPESRPPAAKSGGLRLAGQKPKIRKLVLKGHLSVPVPRSVPDICV